MDTVTHALLPLIAVHSLVPREKRFSRLGLAAVAVAGSLPDFLTPHLTLEARMASWSHGLPFWLLLTLCLLTIAALSKGKVRITLAAWMSGAYLLHLVCDAISGGINWLHPFGRFIWGDYWIGAIWWIPLDVLCILWCYYLFRLQPLLEKKRARTNSTA